MARAAPRAVVIGGSLGGLFAAHMLHHIGWDVAVFERTAGDLAGRGSGLGTSDAMLAAMRRVGIPFDASIGIAVRSRIALAGNGDIICERPTEGLTTGWDRLYRTVRDALPPELYRAGMELTRFEQDDSGVTAVFTDGSRATGDLLIGADGIHSTVRRQLLPQLTPTYAGYVAWRGWATEDDLPPDLGGLLFHHFVFGFPEGELALCVPMADTDEPQARHRAQFTWFRPIDEQTGLPRLCTDAEGRCHGTSIPPPLIRRGLIDALRVEARRTLAPQIATLVERSRQPVLQPIYDLESPRLTFGRVVLLGDAGFLARPDAGGGVTKAALDAQYLADAIVNANGDLDRALADYDQNRSRFGAWLVARGRYLGAYLSAQHKPPEQRHGNERERNPESFLREFGAAGIVDGMKITAKL